METFTPPPLDSIEPEESKFTPPPLDSLEPEESSDFIPPPLDSIELTDSEIITKVGNPTYKPTLQEFKQYKAAKERRPFSIGRVISEAGQAAGVVIGDLAKLGKEVITLEQWRHPRDTAQSIVEGAARSVYDLGLMARKLDPTPSRAGGSFYNEEQYIQYKLARTNQEAFPQGGATEPIRLANVPQETLSQWKQEFKDLKDESDYTRFIQEREYQQPRIQATQGGTTLVPEVIGKVNPEIAEGMSYIADPTTIMPGGMAAKGAGLTEKALAATAAATGKTIEKTGKAIGTVARIPENIASAATKAVTESEEAAAKAAATVSSGTTGTIIGTGKFIGKAVENVGQATEAVGRALPKANERFGLFANIAKDADAPQWLRSSAGRLKKLDTAVASAGAVAKGAAEGSAIGATIGGIAEGEEGFAAGLGSGGVLGATGATAGRLLSKDSRLTAAEDADIDSWMNSKSPEEIENIKASGLTRDDALKMADAERMARGITGKETPGDVEFRYLKSDEFEKQFGPAKGAQVVEGDRPVVYVNTGYKGARSMLHETAHALDALDDFSPQRAEINKLLFDQVASDGKIISKGLYDVEDLVKFANQYESKLSPEALKEWGLLTPDQRSKAVMGEVRAEHFANLIEGSPKAMLPDVSSIKTKLADSLLLAESESMLGKIRGALQKAGIKFDQSGAPSELFVKDGKPITSSPEINAALRDYIRAKDNQTKRLLSTEGDETGMVIGRDELAKGNKAAIEVLKDSDIFAKNPDGSIKTVGDKKGGVPVLLTDYEIRKLQTKRVEKIMEALEKIPDKGDARAVKIDPNVKDKAFAGKYFTDEQVAALKQIPDDIIAPSIKAKIEDINAFLKADDGTQIVLDYNAALKGRKYSSGISVATRMAVPLSIKISKAGNFVLTTLDTSHFYRKLQDWRKSKPKAFEPWQGDVDLFIRDTFKYLDNHANGRPGATGLASDTKTAELKRDTINDFFNVPGHGDFNPIQISTKSEKDNLIRARRLDRINRIQESEGDKFPIDYERLKKNFLPAGNE